jgi:hypothetical protein
MRKFLAVVGAVALALVVVATAGVAFMAWKGTAADAESKAFIDAAVPAIAATWQEQQLLDRATPELLKAAKPVDLTEFFTKLSALGSLIKYDGSTGQSMMSYFTGSGGTVAAAYVAKAEFKNGTATFNVALLKRDGRWMINGFHVDPVLKPTVGSNT